MRHVDFVRLIRRRVSRDVEVAGNTVNEKLSFEATSLAIVDVHFVCVFDKANFVSASIILDVESDGYTETQLSLFSWSGLSQIILT